MSDFDWVMAFYISALALTASCIVILATIAAVRHKLYAPIIVFGGAAVFALPLIGRILGWW